MVVDEVQAAYVGSSAMFCAIGQGSALWELVTQFPDEVLEKEELAHPRRCDLGRWSPKAPHPSAGFLGGAQSSWAQSQYLVFLLDTCIKQFSAEIPGELSPGPEAGRVVIRPGCLAEQKII